jgi:tape measure domain-containing protein
MASAQITRFGNNARSSLLIAQQYTGNLIQRNNTLVQSYSMVQQRIAQVEARIRNSTAKSEIRALTRELRELRREADRSLAGRALGRGGVGGRGGKGGFMGSMSGGLGFAGTPQMMAAAAVVGAGVAAVSFGKSSIDAALERQKTRASFNVLTGSEQAGGALTQQLVDLQKNTILGSEVFDNAQKLLAYGFDTSEITKNLRMIGDVSMGDKQKFDSLTLAFGQIRSKGHLAGQELLQLTERGFNPLEIMSKQSGKSMDTLYKEMGKGKISYKMVEDTLQSAVGEGGRFNNMLETIGKTPAGQVEKLSGQWSEFKVKAGDAMMPLYTGLLQVANAVMPILESAITPIANGFKQASEWVKSLVADSGGWMDYITTFKELFVNHVMPVISKIWGFISDIVKKVVTFVGQSQILKDVYTVISLIVGGIWDYLGIMIDGLRILFDKIIMPIINAIDNAYKFITGRSDKKVTAPAAAPVTPIERENNQILNGIKKKTEENVEATKENTKAVTSGGPKIINISMQKFFDNINIITNNFELAESEIEQRMLEMLGRVVVQAAYAI